jgi:hypothetical protein
MDSNLPLPLQSIHQAYTETKRIVERVLRTQIGDASRLKTTADDCNRLAALVEQVQFQAYQCLALN